MRTSSLTIFTIFSSIALSGLIGMSCASQTIVEGTGGDGGLASTSDASSSSSSSGSGGCVGASDCTAMNDQCNAGTCVNGTCVKGPANEAGQCDDGLFCTEYESCTSGVCTGGIPKFCVTMDTCHVGTCDEATDTCTLTTSNEGGQCDDGDPCTLQGTCSSGTCLKGQPVNCSVFNSTCAIGVCDPLVGCKAMPQNDGTPCNDGLYCTINDVCTAGKCGGAPNVCAPPNSPCLIGSCNEALKTCSNVPAPNGTACDDMSSCTVNTTCTNGVCNGGQPANQGGACDDVKACTANDTCNNGVCNGTAILACANNDGCCPAGCAMANDDDCNCSINLALTATPSKSGGGLPPTHGPEQLNNQTSEASCQFAWISNGVAPSGAYYQYDWPQAVTIGSFYVETANGLNPGVPCAGPAGRNLASGKVQWWDGAAWVTSMTWSGQHDDLKIDLPSPVTTTKFRLFDITTDPGNGNSLVYEWHVYGGTGCMPPP